MIWCSRKCQHELFFISEEIIWFQRNRENPITHQTNPLSGVIGCFTILLVGLCCGHELCPLVTGGDDSEFKINILQFSLSWQACQERLTSIILVSLYTCIVLFYKKTQYVNSPLKWHPQFERNMASFFNTITGSLANFGVVYLPANWIGICFFAILSSNGTTSVSDSNIRSFSPIIILFGRQISVSSGPMGRYKKHQRRRESAK